MSVEAESVEAAYLAAIAGQYVSAREERDTAIARKKRAKKALEAARGRVKRADEQFTSYAEQRRRLILFLLQSGWTRPAIAETAGMTLQQVQTIVPQYLDEPCAHCGHACYLHGEDPSDIRGRPISLPCGLCACTAPRWREAIAQERA